MIECRDRGSGAAASAKGGLSNGWRISLVFAGKFRHGPADRGARDGRMGARRPGYHASDWELSSARTHKLGTAKKPLQLGCDLDDCRNWGIGDHSLLELKTPGVLKAFPVL